MNEIWTLGQSARRWLLVCEVIGALGLTALSLLVTGSATSSSYGVCATIVLLVAFCVRRYSLRWTLALALLAGVLQLIPAQGFIFFANLLYAPLCAQFGSSRDRRMRTVGLATAVAACVVPGVLVIPRWLGQQAHPPAWNAVVGVSLMFTGFAALVSVGGWTWGYLRLQQRLRVEASIAARLSEAERVRLEETYAQSAFRERIAAEMHDVVGHSWAVVAAQADGARYALETSPETAAQALDTIADIARHSITELREILRKLRYTESAEGQISPEQQQVLLDRMRQAGMNLAVTESGEPPSSPALRLTAYRVLSEGLTNVLKHGDLTRPVTVDLTWRDGFDLTIDNAVGGGSRIPGGGMGLPGMRQRVQLLGGRFEAGPHEGRWRLVAHVDQGHEPTEPQFRTTQETP